MFNGDALVKKFALGLCLRSKCKVERDHVIALTIRQPSSQKTHSNLQHHIVLRLELVKGKNSTDQTDSPIAFK